MKAQGANVEAIESLAKATRPRGTVNLPKWHISVGRRVALSGTGRWVERLRSGRWLLPVSSDVPGLAVLRRGAEAGFMTNGSCLQYLPSASLERAHETATGVTVEHFAASCVVRRQATASTTS